MKGRRDPTPLLECAFSYCALTPLQEVLEEEARRPDSRRLFPVQPCPDRDPANQERRP